jgi:HSP20 family protein
LILSHLFICFYFIFFRGKNMVRKKEKKEKLAVRTTKPLTPKVGESPRWLWTDFDRLFDQFRSNFEDLVWYPRSNMIIPTVKTRIPPLNVIDLGDKYEVTVEMPGVPKDNIDINITPNEVEISAESKTDEEEKGKNWLRRERSSMSFYRNIMVPEELRTDEADAELKDGVLTLTLPKITPKPHHKPQKINIR